MLSMERTIDLNESAHGSLTALSAAMLTIATTVVLLRCWSVYADSSRRFGLDDFFAIASLPFYIGECALIFWWISLGLGRHAATLPARDLAEASKIIFASGYLFNTALTFPKLSVLLFYHRIFNRTHQWFYVCMWIAGSLCLAWLLTTYLVATFQCSPVEAAWKEVPGSHCIPIGRIYIGTSTVSTLIDFLIILMPIPMLWGLNISTVRRALIMLVFLCGYCVIVTSLGRLVTVAKVGANLTKDVTWSDVTYIKWVICEGALSITSACLPNLFSLSRRVHRHGLLAALPRKSLDLSQTGTLNHSSKRHNFREIGKTLRQAGKGNKSKKRADFISANVNLPTDQFDSEQELRVFAPPPGARTRRDFLEHGGELP